LFISGSCLQFTFLRAPSRGCRSDGFKVGCRDGLLIVVNRIIQGFEIDFGTVVISFGPTQHYIDCGVDRTDRSIEPVIHVLGAAILVVHSLGHR